MYVFGINWESKNVGSMYRELGKVEKGGICKNLELEGEEGVWRLVYWGILAKRLSRRNNVSKIFLFTFTINVGQSCKSEKF